MLPRNHFLLSDLICPKPFNGVQGLVGQPKHRQGSSNMGSDEERIMKKRRRQRTLFWMLMITLVTLVFSTFIGLMDVYIAKLNEVNVDSYRSTDTERRIDKLYKARRELQEGNPVHKK